jgi:uncharacterized protein YcnI
MNRTVARLSTAAVTAGAALLLLAPTAGAHVGTSAKEVPAGGTLALGLTIGHGCEESPTNKVAVQIPEGIVNATPFAKPGWAITVDKETLAEPIESAHGDPVTERTSVITFTANPGNALPNGIRDTFTINFAAPDAPGEHLYFKTVQSCEVGENAWIQEYDGTGEEPESPAPAIEVTDAVAADEHGEAEEVAAEPTSSTDDDSDAVAIIALIVGIVALGVGGASLAKGRKTS